MVTIAAALLMIGYSLFYVAASNLAHGPGHGVGLTDVLGLSTAPPASAAPSSPASAQSRTPAPGKPKPGATP